MNLFERLYRYREKAGKHERENYLTELLAAVLERYPALINSLCTHAKLTVPADTKFRVRTQVSYAEGQPDIVLNSISGGFLLLIECKLEAGEGDKQLERYQQILATNSAAQRGLIFLTKYYELPPKPIESLRWYQLFELLAKLPASDLLTSFREYLTHHRLHKPMTFLASDLIALEQMQATIAKMDEVISPLEREFRKYLGSTYQYAKSRSANLADGWYGYGRTVSSTNIKAGFRCSLGQIPACFIEVERWANVPLAEESAGGNLFQYALRKAWSIPDAQLNYLLVTKPMTSFMSLASGDEGVAAMRDWFSTHFAQLNTVLEQHEYFWKGVLETIVAPNENQEVL